MAAERDAETGKATHLLADYRQTFDWARHAIDPHGHGCFYSTLDVATCALDADRIEVIRKRVADDLDAHRQNKRSVHPWDMPVKCPEKDAREAAERERDAARAEADLLRTSCAGLLDGIEGFVRSSGLAGTPNGKRLLDSMQLARAELYPPPSTGPTEGPEEKQS